MEQKTKVNAEDGKQEILITREFDLPLELLFNAYIEPKIVKQWMGTKVLKLESKNTVVTNLNQKMRKAMLSYNPMAFIKRMGLCRIFLCNVRCNNFSFSKWR
jgi:hypothetical protein